MKAVSLIEQTATDLIALIVNRLNVFKIAKSFHLQDTVLPRLTQRSRQ